MPTSQDTKISNDSFDGKETFQVYVYSRHSYNVTASSVEEAKEVADERYRSRNAFGEFDQITNIMVVTK